MVITSLFFGRKVTVLLWGSKVVRGNNGPSIYLRKEKKREEKEYLSENHILVKSRFDKNEKSMYKFLHLDLVYSMISFKAKMW